MAWNKEQARLFVKWAHLRAGNGWSLLGRELQEGIIAKQFASVLTSQTAETLNTDEVKALWNDMLIAAGLRGEES